AAAHRIHRAALVELRAALAEAEERRGARAEAEAVSAARRNFGANLLHDTAPGSQHPDAQRSCAHLDAECAAAERLRGRQRRGCGKSATAAGDEHAVVRSGWGPGLAQQQPHGAAA